tara:strand:- start:71 stop:382 length:312 start_codon:yes stop_codon:yes gene_type:complete
MVKVTKITKIVKEGRVHEHGTLLGKCSVDGQPIYEGGNNRSRNATIINGKWISGDVILKLYPKAFQAFLDENKHNEKQKERLLESLGEYGWQVNPETGKLQKL